MAKQHVDATEVASKEPLPVSEMGEPGPVEKVAESNFVKESKLEAFMCDILTVVVHEDTNNDSVVMPCPSVNGLNQPFIRGVDQKVKRKYVEQLARTRTIVYEQRTPDPRNPENIQMDERSALTFPFSVLDDPSPLGKAWLKAILQQPH